MYEKKLEGNLFLPASLFFVHSLKCCVLTLLAGWCSSSFSTKLVAKEVMCRSRGDATCRFIMAPPETIKTELIKYPHSFLSSSARYQKNHPELTLVVDKDMPGFFERRNREDCLQKQAFDDLQQQHLALQAEREKVRKILINNQSALWLLIRNCHHVSRF